MPGDSVANPSLADNDPNGDWGDLQIHLAIMAGRIAALQGALAITIKELSPGLEVERKIIETRLNEVHQSLAEQIVKQGQAINRRFDEVERNFNSRFDELQN